jgi:hypothetical protein
VPSIRLQHLQAYLAEFDLRYSNRSGFGVNDAECACAINGAEGKGLMYQGRVQ